MRKLLLIAGVAVLAVPGLASAQPGCREQQHDNRVAGTVLGAVGGALLGGAISGHASGAVIGGVAGGAVGNVAGGASTRCADYPRSGYYDSRGVWHEADGYYDSDGNWVETRPPAVDYSVAPNPYDYSADVAYTGARGDLSSRESWLESRIQEGDASGAISRGDADRDLRMLAGIRDFQAAKADEHDGLTGDDRDNIASKLDSLSADLRSQWGY
jgi:hypothetical protein